MCVTTTDAARDLARDVDGPQLLTATMSLSKRIASSQSASDAASVASISTARSRRCIINAVSIPSGIVIQIRYLVDLSSTSEVHCPYNAFFPICRDAARDSDLCA